MKPSLAIPGSVPSPDTLDNSMERGRLLFEATGWYRASRLILWAVIATASVKPAEIFGGGEQIAVGARIENGPVDIAFRCIVLLACFATAFVAVAARRVRAATLWFIPFIVWSVLVALGQQADPISFRQLASYATWILFFISACALFDRPEDYKTLRMVLVIAVLTSAVAGTIQYFLGYSPMVGFTWRNIGFPRVHTGGGGILLDAFTPYCAALLLLTASVNRPIVQASAVVLTLWASANILRGGLLGFFVAMLWLLFVAPRKMRISLLKGAGATLLLIALFFGGQVVEKSITADDDVTNEYAFNTSGRFEHWPELIEWIRQEPIWGHGPNADILLLVGGDGGDLRAAHNELLSTAVNFGILGVILLWSPLLALLLCTLYLANKYRHSLPEPLWGAGAVLLMLAVLSLTDNTVRVPGVMILALAPVCVAINWQETSRGADAHAGSYNCDPPRLQRPSLLEACGQERARSNL